MHLGVTCGSMTQTSLDIWPLFPIAVLCVALDVQDEKGEENIIAALEQQDRISDLHIFDGSGISSKR